MVDMFLSYQEMLFTKIPNIKIYLCSYAWLHDYLHLDNVGTVKGQNKEVQIYFLRVEDVLLY